MPNYQPAIERIQELSAEWGSSWKQCCAHIIEGLGGPAAEVETNAQEEQPLAVEDVEDDAE